MGGTCSSGVDSIMFINKIYTSVSVDNFALRIHTSDLKAGLKKGEKGNEGSPVPPGI